jgi:hypothetical protein
VVPLLVVLVVLVLLDVLVDDVVVVSPVVVSRSPVDVVVSPVVVVVVSDVVDPLMDAEPSVAVEDVDVLPGVVVSVPDELVGPALVVLASPLIDVCTGRLQATKQTVRIGRLARMMLSFAQDNSCAKVRQRFSARSADARAADMRAIRWVGVMSR